jgi:hypothetical protein
MTHEWEAGRQRKWGDRSRGWSDGLAGWASRARNKVAIKDQEMDPPWSPGQTSALQDCMRINLCFKPLNLELAFIAGKKRMQFHS